ncbi:MAG: PAS domain-containing protein [Pseudomonadota bacterium]
MKIDDALAAFSPGPWPRRRVAWLGGLFIAAMVGLAAYDIVRGYRSTVAETGRELDTQARVIAEQTARSVQAVDVVLRHLAEQLQTGTLATLSRDELHLYLKEQAVGLVQIDGLVVFNPDGTVRAVSQVPTAQLPPIDVSRGSTFARLRDEPGPGLRVDTALKSPGTGRWVFPIGRRLVSRTGAFAGAVGAPGRVEYFQQFYGDAYPDPGTRIALLHRDGTLLARHPPADAALGKRLVAVEALLPVSGAKPMTTRGNSPIDGIDRFAAVRLVPDYPLAVVVTRDAAAALAPWRSQAIGSALRTLALATLAALLLAVALRQLARVQVARASLEVSQERYALAAAGSDVGVWDWDLVAGTAYESRRARELQGLPLEPETQPLDALQGLLTYHPDDAPRRAALMQAHLDGQTLAYEVEYRVRRADGEYRWIHVRALCIRDAAGKPLRIAGSVSDVDARKRAESALRESEERYALAMTGSNEGHWLWDMPARQIYISAKQAELLGFAEGAGVMADRDYFARLPLHPEDRELVERNRNDHVAGLTPRLDHEFRIVLASGELRWIHSRAQCFRDADGHPLRMAGSSVDATRRKRAEEALRASEQRFASAVAGSDDGIWEWDYVSGESFGSQRGREILGLPPGPELESLETWTAEIEGQLHPDDLPRRNVAIADHLAGRTPAYECDFRVRHPDGIYRWVHVHGRCVRDADGQVLRIAGSASDIDSRKRAEVERLGLEQQLRQAQKLEAIGTLAGGIAHDFNNILSAILGYGELAQKGAPAGTPLRRHVDAAISAGQRAKSLVERILAFSRSGMGERVPVHVQSVVEEVLDGVAATLPSGVRLERSLAAGDAGLLGDPTQIHQVVMNLCANAVQAMRSDGRLTVSLDVTRLEAPLTMTTSTLPAGDYLRLEIADSGAGMAPPMIERIFDPFFTTKEVGVGTGLGLSMVHGIVTDLGGGIAVASRVGEGSTFTVYLPAHGVVRAPAADAAAVDDTTRGEGQTVLLVDDEEQLVRLGEELLAELGYEPVGFVSSTAALEAMRADPARFDAMLSDESMPGLTGRELAAAARRLRPGLPVVLMSGYVSPALMQQAREIGVAEVLAKPLAAREIARALAAALRGLNKIAR